MKIKFLGTGAADWLLKDKKEGEFFRYFSSTLLDEHVLIDLGTGVPLEGLPEIHEIYYTHSHDDHFCYASVLELSKRHPITIYCERGFAERIVETESIKVVPLDVTKSVVTELGYTLVPLKANHQTGNKNEQPICYVISKDDKKIFWGGDGAWFHCQTYSYITALRPFDMMVVDGTLGDVKADGRIFSHNTMPLIRLMYENLTSLKFFKENGTFWLNHFSKLDQYAPDEFDAVSEGCILHIALDGKEVII